MSFNFGGFISGLSKQIVSDIEREKAKQDQFDLLAEQEATKLRLANAAERRKQRKADADNMAFLKTLGFSDAKAQWIMKGGANSVQMYANFAQTAMESGIDPDTILKSNLINDDHNDPRNEANLEAVKNAAIGRPIGVDPSNPYSLNLSVVKRPEDEENLEISSIATGYATSLNQRLSVKNKFGIDSEEYKAADSNVTYWKNEMENDPSKTADTLFNKDSRETIIKNARSYAFQEAGFKYNIETGIVQVIAGKRGPQAVASLEAAGEIALAANPTPNFSDDVLMARAIGIQKRAERDLSSHAKAVVNKTATAETQKFGYNKTKIDDTGKYVIGSFAQALKDGDGGKLKEGDVIIVKQKNLDTGVIEFRIKVYTGIPRAETPLGIFDTFYDAGVYSTPNQ